MHACPQDKVKRKYFADAKGIEVLMDLCVEDYTSVVRQHRSKFYGRPRCHAQRHRSLPPAALAMRTQQTDAPVHRKHRPLQDPRGPLPTPARVVPCIASACVCRRSRLAHLKCTC